MCEQALKQGVCRPTERCTPIMARELAVFGRDTIASEIPRLRRYARALVGNEAEADDLVQDTLERALGRLHLWQSSVNPRQWLLTILHNLHLDRVRGSAQHPALDLLDEALPDPATAQREAVTKCEVSAALQRLPLEQRQTVLLVSIEGLSYAEAASVLNVPIGTVMSRLARGRDKLRYLLEHPAPAAAPAVALRRVK